MRQLTKTQSIIFLAGGVLMAIGAGCYSFLFIQKTAGILFLVGAIAFVSMQILQRYEGTSITIRRLRNIMIIADICFILAGVLMVEQQFGWIRNLFSGNGYTQFVSYTYNKWVVLLLIAAILEMYTMHRIGQELEKESEK